MSHEDRTRERFTATADRLAALGRGRVAGMTEHLSRVIEFQGTERALDVGTGTGTLALALAPLVKEVIGIDPVPAMLERARLAAKDVPNVTFLEGRAERLEFADGAFDLVGCARTIHHVEWPDVAIAEMARVVRTGGRVLVIDQITSVDPLEALAHNRIERLRDPAHVRVLSDQDFRVLFDANDLVLRRFEAEREEFSLDRYLDLAGCEGEQRAEVLAEVERLVSLGQRAGIELRRAGAGYELTLTIAWYVLEKVPPPPPTTAT